MESSRLFEIHAASDFLRIHLRGPRGHALDTEGLAALADAVSAAGRDGSRPLLLTASGRSFCTGLDLDFACALDRDGLRELMRAFHRALSAIFLYRGGTVAAIGGNALAGGAILALACDARVVAEGAGRMGIHGIRMGIAYPDVAIEIVASRFGRSEREGVLYGGRTLSVEEAYARGWAHALVPPDDLTQAAGQRLAKIGAGSRAFAENKARIRAEAARRLESPESDGEERFLDVWFSRRTQALLAARK